MPPALVLTLPLAFEPELTVPELKPTRPPVVVPNAFAAVVVTAPDAEDAEMIPAASLRPASPPMKALEPPSTAPVAEEFVTWPRLKPTSPPAVFPPLGPV